MLRIRRFLSLLLVALLFTFVVWYSAGTYDNNGEGCECCTSVQHPKDARAMKNSDTRDSDSDMVDTMTRHNIRVTSALTHPPQAPAEGERARTVSIPLSDNITAVNSDVQILSSPYILSQEEQARCWNSANSTAPDPSEGKAEAKLILYWQEGNYFPKKGTFRDRCFRPTKGPCELTFQLSQHAQADAVVVHASRIALPKPPFKKMAGQIWVARGMESPNNWLPGYKAPGWRGLFNWTMTYRTDSDLFAPVGQLVRQDGPARKDFRAIAAGKTRSVAWFVSTCYTGDKYGSYREDYTRELQKYIDVDIYGECGTLSCPKHQKTVCYDLLTRKYRFYLSFENSLCKEYVTEKFFDKFGRDANETADIIPIVLGGTDYTKYFPNATYINTADFPSPKHLAKYLRALGKDTEAYATMLEKKSWYVKSRCKKSEPWCQLCDMLHEHKNLTPKLYDDLSTWLEKGACVKQSDLTYYKRIGN